MHRQNYYERRYCSPKIKLDPGITDVNSTNLFDSLLRFALRLSYLVLQGGYPPNMSLRLLDQSKSKVVNWTARIQYPYLLRIVCCSKNNIKNEGVYK